MAKQLFLAFAVATFLLFLGAYAAAVVPAIGVKQGDWIEYNVVTTGTPQEGHDVTWARMHILNVQGTEITVNVTTRSSNGTMEVDIMTLNPGKGEVGVWFIIPPNLAAGEAFYDASTGKNVTIEGAAERVFAGATRTVTHATTPERIKTWDKTTGVFVESIDVRPEYTLNATANKTNLWSPEVVRIDERVFYAVMGAVVAVIVVAVFVVVTRWKKK